MRAVQEGDPAAGPVLRRASRPYRVIGIDSNDQTANALKFVAREGVTYPVATDPFPATRRCPTACSALPQTFFLNARHRIVRHIFGDVTASELSAWADQLSRDRS